MRFITDPAARLAQLRSGTIDCGSGPDQLAEIKRLELRSHQAPFFKRRLSGIESQLRAALETRVRRPSH